MTGRVVGREEKYMSICSNIQVSVTARRHEDQLVVSSDLFHLISGMSDARSWTTSIVPYTRDFQHSSALKCIKINSKLLYIVV